MLSPFRIHPNNTKKRTKNVKYSSFDKNSHREHDLERLLMTSDDLERPQSTSNENVEKIKTKNNLKGRFIQENVEINEQYLDEILEKSDI